MQLIVSGIALLFLLSIFEIGKTVVEFIYAAWPFLVVALIIYVIVAIRKSTGANRRPRRYSPELYEPMYESRATPAVRVQNVVGQVDHARASTICDDSLSTKTSPSALSPISIAGASATFPFSGADGVRSRTLKHSAERQPSRGLVIQGEFLEMILSGRKTWEMRSRRTSIRGSIALIRKGSGKIYGVADIVDSLGPLTMEQIEASIDKHAIERSRIDAVLRKYKHAWVLANVRRLRQPVEYGHRSGAVIFVKLDASTREAVLAQL